MSTKSIETTENNINKRRQSMNISNTSRNAHDTQRKAKEPVVKDLIYSPAPPPRGAGPKKKNTPLTPDARNKKQIPPPPSLGPGQALDLLVTDSFLNFGPGPQTKRVSHCTGI